jgi:bifunctional DNA-binding transcriptional regulator/antitoxin component of YhaV-PrlF toxin-antitoxin module
MTQFRKISRIDGNGRLVLPARQRKALGLEDGGAVVMDIIDGHLVVQPMDQVLADIQAQVRKYLGPATGHEVDDFIAERRAEARQEEARYPSD